MNEEDRPKSEIVHGGEPEPQNVETEAVPQDMFEVPLVNCSFEVSDFEPEPGVKGKAILLETTVSMLIGNGMMTPPKQVRFVIPLLEEAAQNLGAQLLNVGGIQVASAIPSDLPPPPVAAG